MFLTVALGVADAFARGFSLTDLSSMPVFGDKEARTVLAMRHGFVADLLIAVALFHAAAALSHHFVLKDGVLARMAPEPHPAVEEHRLESFDA